MKTLNQDIALGALFLSGTWGFISGDFIVSSVLFASAAIFSNMTESRFTQE